VIHAPKLTLMGFTPVPCLLLDSYGKRKEPQQKQQDFLLFTCCLIVVLGIIHARGRLMESKTRLPDSGNVESQGEELQSYSEDGIDLTLIRWMLSLTTAQRLQVLQQAAGSLQKLRNPNPGPGGIG
jgi:hypothetical protein